MDNPSISQISLPLFLGQAFLRLFHRFSFFRKKLIYKCILDLFIFADHTLFDLLVAADHVLCDLLIDFHQL